MQRLVITHKRAPGDTLVLTGLVRDLAVSHPGRYEIFVNTNGPALWDNNPYCKPALALADHQHPGVKYHQADYGVGIRHHKNETIHFLAWMHRDFETKHGVAVPVTAPRPDLHLSPDELIRPIAERYWVINAGGKLDYPTKIWPEEYSQRVVDTMRERGIACAQIGTTERSNPAHWHPRLRGVVDMINKTDLRGLVRLVKHADGVICGVTMAMHAAAALERPCVVYAGGREAWWWEAYVNPNRGFGAASGSIAVPHRFLHTIGLLDCCEHHGCWKHKVMPAPNETSICSHTERVGGQVVPLCLKMVTPEHVVDAVMSYYTDKTLPPIDAKAPESLPRPEVSLQPLLSQRDSADTKAFALPDRIKPASRTDSPPRDPAFDNPVVGGKFTVFALMYGEYPEMHEKFLASLTATLPRGRFDLRIGSNQLGARAVKMVEDAVESGVVTRHYRNHDNRFKYPVMRAMFRDESLPIETPYLVWFDDDTLCDVDPEWCGKLAAAVTEGHPLGCRLYGPHYRYTLAAGQSAWVRQASWYRGRMFCNNGGAEVPNGQVVHFASGGFWALSTAVMRDQDIPDVRLRHNGGDWNLGCAVQQGGWKLKAFSNKKEIVRWSAFARRGFSEDHPGTPGWRPNQH